MQGKEEEEIRIEEAARSWNKAIKVMKLFALLDTAYKILTTIIINYYYYYIRMPKIIDRHQYDISPNKYDFSVEEF